MKKMPIGLICALLLGLSAPVMAQTMAENQANQQIDWVHNVIRAQGVGRAPARITDSNQQKTMAIKAARADAYRQLASVVGEVTIIEQMRVADYIKSKKIQVSGLIQGARLVGQPIFDAATASATVVLELPIYGPKSLASQIQLAELLQQQRSQTRFVSPLQSLSDANPHYASLVIDARHLKIPAQIIPTLCTQDECLVFDENQLERGLFQFSHSLGARLAEDQADGFQPLVIKVQALDPQGRLLISPQDLKQIQAANLGPTIEQRRMSLVL